jgi:hypothetical protein
LTFNVWLSRHSASDAYRSGISRLPLLLAAGRLDARVSRAPVSSIRDIRIITIALYIRGAISFTMISSSFTLSILYLGDNVG